MTTYFLCDLVDEKDLSRESVRHVNGAHQTYKGVTLDGDAVYHTVYDNPDTVVYRGEHCYVLEVVMRGQISLAVKSEFIIGKYVST